MDKLPKQFKKAHKASVKQGWTWDHRGGSKHVTVRDSSGEFVVCISLTLYDGTITRRIQGKLRKAGCPAV